MNRSILVVAISLLLQNCKTYTLQMANTNPYVSIDSSYDYYIREYYVEEKDNRFDLKSKQEIAGSVNKILIEVEYLFISKDDKDNVIYMTTVPDRRQQRYSDNYLGKDSVNMHDVRMLHFGKKTGIDKDSFLFMDFKHSEWDIWTVKKSDDPAEINVKTIAEIKSKELNEVMVVQSALATPVVFEKVNQFHLVYYNPQKPKKGTAVVDGNRLYYNSGKPTEILLYYDKEISDRNNVQRYKKKKIVYDPENTFR
jgi:hypothetical protein